jgi:hypothetical protein
MEGTKQKSPYQRRVFRPKPSLLRGKLRPSQSFGNLNWLRTNHKGRICFRFFLIVISSLGVPPQSLSLCGVLLLPSADCDSIRAARRFVSTLFLFDLSQHSPGDSPASGWTAGNQGKLAESSDLCSTNFFIQRGRESSLCATSRDPRYDSEDRG